MVPRLPKRARATPDFSLDGEAQAGANVSYNLHSLGWAQFQDLCATILRVELAQEVSTFARTTDGGRDGAFYGKWNAEIGGLSGSGTLQCKFSARREAGLTLSTLREELRKATQLAAQGLAHNYVLMTNMTVLGDVENEVRNALLAIAGIEYAVVYGRDWLTAKIQENSHLRMLVPRIYGIGDLQKIINARHYAQAKEVLNYLGGNLVKFVKTKAYTDSVEALSEVGFVLLLGAPATGKSTIASALSLGAIDRWKAAPIRVSTGREFRDAWDPSEKQCFWVDDAFGATQYQAAKVDDWVQTFPFMLTAVNSNATKIIFTSRTYVFERALGDLKTSAFPPINDSRVRIAVEKYSIVEREAILYNHLRMGSQVAEFKRKLVTLKVLHDVAKHERFTPVVARRLADPAYTRKLPLTHDDVIKFVENQGDYVIDALEALDDSSYGALSLIFMGGGYVEGPLRRDDDQKSALERLGTNAVDASKAMRAMEGTFVRRIQRGSTIGWQFDHPSLSDALSAILSRNIEQLEIYVRGAKLDDLLDEVTCGSRSIVGAVVVPESLYDLLLKRLDGLSDRFKDRDRLLSFLLARADQAFLRAFQARHPAFTKNFARQAHYDTYSTSSRLLSRMFDLKLLEEADKVAAANSIMTSAIESLDPTFAKDGAGGLLTDSQVASTLEHIKTERLSDITSLLEDIESGYESPADPDDHFADVVSNLQALRDIYENDVVAVGLIDDALEDIQVRIDSLVESLPPGQEADDSGPYERSTAFEPSGSDRDFFEDVAEPL